MKLFIATLTLIASIQALAGYGAPDSVIGPVANEVKVSTALKGYALGQIATRNLAGANATSLIETVLSGDTMWSQHTNILETKCSAVIGTKNLKCIVGIGTKYPLELGGGRFWDEYYQIHYSIDSNQKVLTAKIFQIR